MIIAADGEVVLREITREDLPRMAELGNNEKVSINLTDAFPFPYTLEDAWKFFDLVQKQEPRTIFAIEYRGEYAGNISLMPGQDVYRKGAFLGYFIGEPFWNKGIVTRAVNLITEYGFTKLDLVRIHTGVFDYNKASQRVLEKCGFEREGTFKKSVIKKGMICDEIRFAKIRSEKE
jgi:RimJ/RimL family protein N-acetyltransferase